MMDIREEVKLAEKPEATQDSILQEELSKLDSQKNQLMEEHDHYVSRHPELHGLVDEFVASVMKHRPEDIIQFGFEFFNKRRGGYGHTNPHGQVASSAMVNPLVICGPSGVGKGTLIDMLKQRYPDHFGFSVSHTTRAPRAGEQDGVHYHFVTKEHMEEEIAKGKFIEHAHVHTNIYGTSYEAVENVQSQGKICILDVDTQGVRSIKKSPMDCFYLFITPPSREDLESRLRNRNTESEDKIQIRLKNSIEEIDFGTTPGNFDAIVTNQDVEVAFNEIAELLTKWYPNFEF